MEVRWRAALERPVELRWNYQPLVICLDFQFALRFRFRFSGLGIRLGLFNNCLKNRFLQGFLALCLFRMF